jgi:UDP-GlcNAc:undecaprenyl-phosphate GlcNAc-1-phosphate transferase
MALNIFAFGLALLLALVLIPVLSAFARRCGLIDNPDKLRKLHNDSIPMVGGMTLILIVPLVGLLTIVAGFTYDSFFSGITQSIAARLPFSFPVAELVFTETDRLELLGLLFASILLFAVGAVDDRFNIRGRQKLLGQFLAATILILTGYQFEHLTLFGQRIEFGVLSGIVIYLWVLAAINSVNLLDGADGIASTIGIIMSLAIAMMALYMGRIVDAVIAAALAGTLLGFLRFNFPPAKAYLGDAGSMLIGLVLAALAIRCMFKFNTIYAFVAPLSLLAIPFIDTAAAIIRRRLTGRSIFAVDRGHLHHSLIKRGYSPRVSLLWVAMLTATTAAGAFLSLVYRRPEFALTSIGIVLFVMIACRIFGWAEYQLVSTRARSFASSFFRLGGTEASHIIHNSVHVQGNRNWKEVWRLLFEFAEEHQLDQLTLDVNAPWLHESFHATRRLSATKKRIEGSEWFVAFPLIVQQRVCGRVEIKGTVNEILSHHDVVRNLQKVLADIEYSLNEISIHQALKQANAHPDQLEHGVAKQADARILHAAIAEEKRPTLPK